MLRGWCPETVMSRLWVRGLALVLGRTVSGVGAGDRVVWEAAIVNGCGLFEVKVAANTRQILEVERD